MDQPGTDDLSRTKTGKFKMPFVAWIVLALVLGALTGWLGREGAWMDSGWRSALKTISGMVLRALQMLATPLIFLAVVLALLRATIGGRNGIKLGWLLITNTLVAICIGLLVVNIIRPGEGTKLGDAGGELVEKVAAKKAEHVDVLGELLKKIIPKSVIAPFMENDMLGVVVISLLLGFALRIVRKKAGQESAVVSLEGLLETGFQATLVVLHWVFLFIPLAVFSVVAATVAAEGLGTFAIYGKFIVAVLLALLLQAIFYITRVTLGSWVRPVHFLSSAREALVVAFSTASSTATLPVTYRCARDKMGLRDENARLGTMVGGNLNNDGTALYEAMAALFIAQFIGLNFDLWQQLVVVLMAVVASVGAAGIPEAGLVTMIAVFNAVKLPVEYIPFLLTVDWFLDRCRTAINVMGDFAVSCILDGKVRKS